MTTNINHETTAFNLMYGRAFPSVPAAVATQKPGPLHYSPTINGISHGTLTKPAYDVLEDKLEGWGNVLSNPHKAALMAMVGSMTEMAQGKLKGRWAFGLPTGMGKTTAIIAWVATLCHLGITHVSVAVSASKVEALCNLKRDMIDAGVPAESIGLVHSKKHDPSKLEAIKRGDKDADRYATEPSEGHNRQILLVTHQRVRGCELDTFNCYKGKPRDLLIYDESLIVSDSSGIAINLLNGAVAWLSAAKANSTAHQGLIAYLTECKQLIAEALERCTGDVQVLRLPVPPDAFETLQATLGRQSVLDPAYQLLTFASQDIRVIPSAGGGVVSYRVSVPKELANVLVLDASQPIRKLVQLDPTIKDAEKHLPQIRNVGVPLSRIKRFDHVTIHQMFAGGGRSSMTERFSRARPEDREVAQEVIRVVQGIPGNETILIFVFKENAERVDFRNILIGDMEKAGVNVSATVGNQALPRISIITWGMETSLNDYAHCKHVILTGVLQRSPLDISASYLGQTDDLQGDLVATEVSDILRSEVCHAIYQALSRGACRTINNGYASPMTGYIIHRDDRIKADLERVMIGAQWKVWEPAFGEPKSGTIAKLARQIGDYLDDLPTETDKVSTRKIKEHMQLKKVAPETWRLALHRHLETTVVWVMESRSLVRTASIFPT